ncbi:unnamed protein product [Coccothraustes coccothraustes]
MSYYNYQYKQQCFIPGGVQSSTLTCPQQCHSSGLVVPCSPCSPCTPVAPKVCTKGDGQGMSEQSGGCHSGGGCGCCCHHGGGGGGGGCCHSSAKPRPHLHWAKVPSSLVVVVEEEEVAQGSKAKAPCALGEAVEEEEVEEAQATRAKVPSSSSGVVVEVEVEVAHPALEECPCSSRPSPSAGHLRPSASSGCQKDSATQEAQEMKMPDISSSIKFKIICLVLFSLPLGMF